MKYVIRKWTLILIVLLALFGSALCIKAHAFSGGNGTPDDPYIITSAAELNAVRHNLTAHFRLGNDVDLTCYLAPGGAGYAKWGAAGWQPIGTWSFSRRCEYVFSGEFDGNGYKITGLWIDRSGWNFVGLFGATENAVIKNLGVEIAIAGNINGHNHVGGLIGWQSSGSIVNTYVMGNVSGNSEWHAGGRYVGGLVGKQYSASVINSHATGNVSGSSDVGGLVGYQHSSSIRSSYATGSVSGASNSNVGGLVGYQRSGSIESSYATGNVTGRIGGGLVGIQGTLGSITNSYATGNVSGDIAGGLVGSQYGSITNSYATGNIGDFYHSRYIGGLAGSQGRGSIKNSYATGNLVGREPGGLVGGWSRDISITNSYRYINLTINGMNPTEYTLTSFFGTIITVPTENMPDGIHGGILTAAQFMTKATYTDNDWLFYPDGPWHWDERGFPKLNIGAEDFPFNFTQTAAHELSVN